MPTEASGSITYPAVGVTGGCELPSVGTGNGTKFSSKSHICFDPCRHSLVQPAFVLIDTGYVMS